MMLEDLPLHAPPPPVDPKLIPRRIPSEDAKRLGLSSKAPPLPPQPGSLDAAQRVQANLQAYHAALANAANKAAADGRFLRMPSTSTARSSSTHTSGEDGGDQPTRQVSTDDRSHFSRNEDSQTQYTQNNYNGDLDRSESTETAQSKANEGITSDPPKLSFDFGFGFDVGTLDDSIAENINDDFMNDDDVIAEANADALASDDEGFYGQEFGFYAKARPNSGERDPVNGGYFGLDGDDGLARNKSLKEPNLTPITERSEFSTRNSMIGHGGMFGLPSAGGSFGGGMSPSLARMPVLPLGEDEVTSFDQLRKLRAHAFGGSNASLHSDGKGSRSSLNMVSESPHSAAAASGYFGPLGGAPMSFGYSTDSSGSSNPSSAQPHQQHAGHSFQDSPQSAASSGQLPFSMENEATPKRALPNANADAPLTVRRASLASSSKAKGHSRNSSGADSVTYVREQDGDGPPRWVLERRRASEQGQLELVAREIVQGGWI